MGKEATITKAILEIERCRNILAEYGCKELFTAHGFRCLGYITSDKKLPDEATGKRKRWIKGYRFINDEKLPDEDRIFETCLHRYNKKSGDLDEVIVHEDDFVLVMERKTFDLSDDEGNFQFVPNMHLLSHVHIMKDELSAAENRVHRIQQEKEQSFVDAEHFKREAMNSKSRFKSNSETLNRLTRENSNLQGRIGTLEATNQNLRAKNLEFEATMDELLANAQEKGTVRGMSNNDRVLHAIENKKEVDEKLLDTLPDTITESEDGNFEVFNNRLEKIETTLSDLKGTKV